MMASARAPGGWDTAIAVLRLAGQLVDGIQAGLARRGFDDVRPAHGFVFTCVAGSAATTTTVAAHLGITKQAASQLVGYLVERGYLERQDNPQDRRSRVLSLTEQGWACTAAAEEAAAETVAKWTATLTPAEFEVLHTALRRLVVPGRLRPIW